MLVILIILPWHICAVSLVNTCMTFNGPVPGCNILGIIPGGLVKRTPLPGDRSE
jgi:hypothetical protein